ncbi:MAG TPA: phosphate ABC transporter permease PstA [Rhizomicrobium sp.]|jgi:phosphate transport system permease protein|nr:phosphate ABC transporter permease PstA [Rhizomicrobium sp.]
MKKNNGLIRRRKVWNVFFLLMSVAAALFGIGWLGFILGELLVKGVAGLSPDVFTKVTMAPNENGGLANAILGSAIMSGLAVAVGTPIGLLAGTYLAEYGRHSRLAGLIRFVNDILLSTPSILTGLFIYVAIVVPMGGFSGWAGAAVLAVIVIPVVVRTTENMLLLVPNGLREAAAALGAPRSSVIRAVTWRAARAGIVTGVLLAVARISGETAPLLFTAFGNWNMSHDLGQPMESLPHIIYSFANSAYDDWHALAWAGALLITAAVLTLSIVARLLQPKRS